MEVKVNHEGVRGIFATKAVKADEHILSVPASAILNAGGVNNSFAVGQMVLFYMVIIIMLRCFATQSQVPDLPQWLRTNVPGANLVCAP